MPVRTCFGNFMICPIDDECVVAKECALYCNALIQLSDFAAHNEAVIQELERLKSEWSFKRLMKWEHDHDAPIKIYQEVMDEAISLLKGVKV